MKGWIGVDLDGTLAYYDGWKGATHIGEPVPAMLERVLRWLSEGHEVHGDVEVRIMTARVSVESQLPMVMPPLNAWMRKHIGRALMVTCMKDYAMLELWDDRVVQVEANTGRRMDGVPDYPEGEPA